jgi:serine/threonine protein kinase
VGSPLTRNEILLGAKLGPYEVVRFIGQGGTASVFEGRHTALRKPVAIKILHDHLANDADVAARFVREGRIAAQLRHPNSLDVLDVGEERGVAYLVMELLDGSNLNARLIDHRILPIDEALGVFFPVAAALAHAHAHGIVHRDVKPGNIFLARDARGTVVPKLVDFGISKLVDAPEGAPLTVTNVMLGTVMYMAPEQTMSGKAATAKSDQYSLAAVLYECLAGRAPFEAVGFYELLEAVRNSVLPPPSSSNARLPKELDEVLTRALDRDPAKRFASVKAFAAELLPFASDALAEAWKRDFVDSSTGTKPASSSRSSASVKLGTADAQVRPDPAPTKLSERRHPSAQHLLAIPRDVKIVDRAPAPVLIATTVSRRADATPAKPTDWVVPYPKPRAQIADAKHFRSTWLTASQATIRGRGPGVWEQYERALDPKHSAAVLSAVAGVWLPMDVARAHYMACDKLGLADLELVEIGRAAMRRANATALSLVTRMAQGAGVTPWTALGQVPRFWSATCDDGFMAVAKLGPKEARVEVVGYPLAGIRYNRVTMRGICVGCIELFCQKAYVKELTPQCDHHTLVMKLSWV